MRLLKTFAAVALLPLLITACSTTPRGGVDRRLAPPKTYDFLPDKTMLAADEAGLSNGPYWHGKVEEAISAELAQKGYKVGAGKSSDFLVAIHVITQRGKKTTFLDNYAGYALSAQEQAEQAEIVSYLNTPGATNRAILIIDVIDPGKREVVWREWTQSPIKKRPTAKVQEQRIKHAVHEILSKFPPKK